MDTRAQAGRGEEKAFRMEVKQAQNSFVPAQGAANPGQVCGSAAGGCGVQRKEFRPEHKWGGRWGARAGTEGNITGPQEGRKGVHEDSGASRAEVRRAPEALQAYPSCQDIWH